MPEPILSIEHLSKSFGALRVSDDVSLTVLPGEIHAIIGPNGAGKTSLIAQISGLLRPDGGRILFRGEDITGLPVHQRARRGLARSFQITNLLPEFTALENVAIAAQARSGSGFRFFQPAWRDSDANARASEALRSVGLEDRPEVAAAALSHGEQRALELAIALVQEPELLLLDEPLAGTGRAESGELIALIRQLGSRFSVLLVEHDMDAVFALADRVSVLVYGRLIATGKPAEIRADAAVRDAYLGEAA